MSQAPDDQERQALDGAAARAFGVAVAESALEGWRNRLERVPTLGGGR